MTHQDKTRRCNTRRDKTRHATKTIQENNNDHDKARPTHNKTMQDNTRPNPIKTQQRPRQHETRQYERRPNKRGQDKTRQCNIT